MLTPKDYESLISIPIRTVEMGIKGIDAKQQTLDPLTQKHWIFLGIKSIKQLLDEMKQQGIKISDATLNRAQNYLTSYEEQSAEYFARRGEN